LIWQALGLPKDTQPRRQDDGSVVLDLANVAAFAEEPFAPPERMLKARVDFFYVIGDGNDPKYLWKSEGAQMATSYEKFIGVSKGMARVVNETVSATDSVETKLHKLYDRAQQVRFVSYEPARTVKEEQRENLKDNKNADDVLKHGYAFTNEINLLFVAMARAAGFDSAPVLVAARDKFFFDENSLDKRQVDAMVVWVKAGGSDYYFDPATRFCPSSLLPWTETATGGIRVESKNTQFVKTPSPRSEDAIIERKTNLQIDAQGGLGGNLRVRFKGYEALQRRMENRERDEAARRKTLEDEVKGWLPAGSTATLNSVGKWDEASESLDADFIINIANFGAKTQGRLLLPLAVFESTSIHAFQGSRRVHSVYFDYPYQELDEVTLQVPPDRKVEALPGPRSQTTPFGIYKASHVSEARCVTFQRRVVMNSIYFKAEEYPQLRAFLNYVRAGDEDLVALQNTK